MGSLPRGQRVLYIFGVSTPPVEKLNGLAATGMSSEILAPGALDPGFRYSRLLLDNLEDFAELGLGFSAAALHGEITRDISLTGAQEMPTHTPLWPECNLYYSPTARRKIDGLAELGALRGNREGADIGHGGGGEYV